MPSLHVCEKIIRCIISLSPHRISGQPEDPDHEFTLQKESLLSRWKSLLGTEKLLAAVFFSIIALSVIQGIWIIVLQYQVSQLAEQTHIQQTRMAQLEQASQKHNNLLYATYVTMDDIQKKWNGLNFRVLENTWKLNK